MQRDILVGVFFVFWLCFFFGFIVFDLLFTTDFLLLPTYYCRLPIAKTTFIHHSMLIFKLHKFTVMKFLSFALIASLCCLYLPGRLSAQSVDTICILQLNDVYEIAPLDQGRQGGLARVATVVKQQESRYKTFVVLAGDFVSPSVIGTTKINGQRVYGRHMVDMMNLAGVDLVTFGNHEFDIPEKDLQQRINESKFAWVSSDVLHKNADGTTAPFYKTQPDSVPLATYLLLPSAHQQFTVGIVSATIASNKQPWVEYTDYLQTTRQALKKVKRQSNVVIGLTHLTLASYEILLRKMKGLALIMGGHEHKNNYVTIGKSAIAKADANAKTMYRHLLFRDGRRGKIKIVSDLIRLDSTVSPDPTVAAAVKVWEDNAYAAFRAIGLEPNTIVYRTTMPLDGTEANMRFKQTNLGNLVAASMMAASPEAAAAIFNSGSVRIDDMLEGVITQLDIIRTLPFGGKLVEVTLTGSLLNQLLTVANTLKGSGGYLQYSTNLQLVDGGWVLNGAAIDGTQRYTIVAPEFLFSGAEVGLEFLKEGNAGIIALKRFDAAGDVRTDIRLAVVKYLSGLH